MQEIVQIGDILMSSKVRRTVGRPSGTPLDRRVCPHGRRECLGPGFIAEQIETIISVLKSNAHEYEFGEILIRTIANRMLAYLGRHASSETTPDKAACPFGADCVSPGEAIRHLWRLWLAVLQSERTIYEHTGCFPEVGETAPTLIVHRIAQTLGDPLLAQATCTALTIMHRDMRVDSDPFSRVLRELSSWMDATTDP